LKRFERFVLKIVRYFIYVLIILPVISIEIEEEIRRGKEAERELKKLKEINKN
jgi:hypothetical protein